MAEYTSRNGLLELADVKLYVEDTGGNGRPVVLIHGWPLSGASWKAQVPVLQEAGYRVVTYDRRGFGRSDKPPAGYSYDALAQDLENILTALNLHDVTLVGFSMGGGEVARYVGNHSEDRLHSVVFAAAVPPMMMKGPDNPDGPLEPTRAAEMAESLTQAPEAFYGQFTKDFFSPLADGNVQVTEAERQEALALCRQASKVAALECMQSFAFTDFRGDLPTITLPTLVIHGDADGIVPFEGSGQRTHAAIPQSQVHLIGGGTHGINATHSGEFNRVLLGFLGE